ncbi:MAG: peptidoglycan-binding protein [Congregibacter sp.]
MPQVANANIRTTTERIRRIQLHLKLEPDGVLGPQTLSALEDALDIESLSAQLLTRKPLGLMLTRDGVSEIVRHEIGSDAHYRRELQQPTWPGGESGVTIGIGYDLGYTSVARFELDWTAYLGANELDQLRAVCGVKKSAAGNLIGRLQQVSISLPKARKVFRHSSLYEYARRAQKAYPGLERLEPDAQSAIVSLVFNRGVSMRGASRREMLNIRQLIDACDYEGIACEIESMKRIWEGRNLNGLLKRRDAEAAMVRGACRFYQPSDLVEL